MHQSIINNIFNRYKQEGYVSEDAVFDALVENNVPLDKVDYICEVLLSMGVIIKNDDIDEDDDTFIYDYSQTNYEEVFKQVIEIDKGLIFFINKIRTIFPPQRREWHNLILQAQNRNKYAKRRIVLMYLRNIVKTALHYHQRYNISLPEAIQDGCIGLIIAIKKFEMGKQDNFSQYAPWWIRQYIMRRAELKGSFFRYPIHYKEKMFSTYDIVEQHSCPRCLKEKLCTSLVEEVSEKLECNYIDAVTLINSLSSVSSLEEMIETNENTFSDGGLFEEELDNFIASKELKVNLEKILSSLKDREREIIELRFGLNDHSKPKTLEEIGNIFGVTRERIRQIEAKSIKKLRHPTRAKSIKQFWFE